jgi:chromosome partitioning protein
MKGMKTKIIAIINQKGGVGKSTTAHALGAGLSLKGFKALFVDLDAQGNLTHTLNAPQGGLTAMEILTKEVETSNVVHKGDRWDCIFGTPILAGADMMLTQTGKEFRLKEALEPIQGNYDYIVIDTPPALGILTINALTACTGIIVPAQADIYSLQGIGQLYETIKPVRQYCNHELRILGILLTRYNQRSIISRDIAEMMEQTATQLGTIVYKATIREAVAVKEAQARQRDIYSYAPKGRVTADYTAFVEEVLEQ